jgi:hypothetical protein
MKECRMLNPARRIVIAVVLTSAVAVATTTPSQAQWYGWGWGAPVVVVAPAYGGYYGYPAYGYPAYGYGIVSYRVPAGYAGYGPTPPSYVGQSYGFVSPSYGYAYASALLSDLSASSSLVAGPAYASDPK